MGIELKIFRRKDNSCLHICIGKSPTWSSIYWLDIDRQFYDKQCHEIEYVTLLFTFWVYKRYKGKEFYIGLLSWLLSCILWSWLFYLLYLE